MDWKRFENIQCYDAIKVNALLNQIKGKRHNGTAAVVPAVFGMNFQAVYTGESVNESGVGTGGYQNAAALPSAVLLQEIEFVDSSIGELVNALKDQGIYDDTLIIVTAKHGASPIDTTRYVADGANTPATLLGTMIPYSESPLNPNGIGATEDDVSVLWLKKGVSVTAAVALLEQNASAIGLGQIYYGPALALNYNVGGTGPGQDPRSPDIIVTPNLGVTYSGSTTMIADHGGVRARRYQCHAVGRSSRLRGTRSVDRNSNHAGSPDHPEGAGSGSATSGRGESGRHRGAARGLVAALKVVTYSIAGQDGLLLRLLFPCL